MCILFSASLSVCVFLSLCAYIGLCWYPSSGKFMYDVRVRVCVQLYKVMNSWVAPFFNCTLRQRIHQEFHLFQTFFLLRALHLQTISTFPWGRILSEKSEKCGRKNYDRLFHFCIYVAAVTTLFHLFMVIMHSRANLCILYSCTIISLLSLSPALLAHFLLTENKTSKVLVLLLLYCIRSIYVNHYYRWSGWNSVRRKKDGRERRCAVNRVK